jgi:hypothetical protein
MGDCPFLPGEECGEGEGLPTTVVGEEGEDGRLNGDARGELKDNGEGLYVEACSVIQHCGGEGGRTFIPCLQLSRAVLLLRC